MDIKFFNSLSKKEETFFPLSKEHVTLYTCGPTVYDYAHIGNFRAYIFGDILKRVLTFNGFTVLHIMNLTDIDDKTISNSQKAGKTLREFTEFYTEKFYEDRDLLNIIPASRYTKATDYIPEMVKIIEALIDKGFAYKGEDASIYFNTQKDLKYGRLVEIQKEKLKNNASNRMKADEYDKDSAQDFALWKAWDESDGDIFWETSLGKGRPGWHIECSAMAMKELGETIDIHTGGLDNMFPHHENEIAQSEAATGKQFAKFFMHNGWLLVDGQKMAKSLGNFYTLKNIVDRGFNPLSFRMMTLQTHYKSPLNFTWESLEAAEKAREKVLRFVQSVDATNGQIHTEYLSAFTLALNSDLNTPSALSSLFNLLSDPIVLPEDKKATILKFDEVLGLRLSEPKKEIVLSDEIRELLSKRAYARDQKNWSLADSLREEIAHLGFEVKDTETGQEINEL